MDDDLASGVWEKLDVADPTSPLQSVPFCGGKDKTKKSNDNRDDSYTRVDNERQQMTADNDKDDDGAVAAEHALLWRMWRVTKPLVMAQGVWQLVATLTEFVPSIAMQQIIDFVSSYKSNTGEGVTGRITLFVVLLFVGPVLQGIADGRNFHLGRRIGCRVGFLCL